MSSITRSWRIEDLLAATFALALVAYSGSAAVLAGIRFEEGNFWEFSFIVAPMALLVFLASLRYALGGGDQRVTRTLREMVAIIRDWTPFLLFLLFYEAFRMNIWQLIHRQDRDAELLAWDRRLFGETPAVWMQQLITPAFTDVLALAYFLHLVLPPTVAFVWYRRKHAYFRECLLAVLLCGVLGTIGYMSVPAVGPEVAFPELFSTPLEGWFYAPVTTMLDAARAPRDVFPSLHVGLSTVVLWYGAKLGRRWFYVLLAPVVLNWFSTMYLRYHYLVDVFAGWAVAALAIWLAGRLLRVETRWHGAREAADTP